MKKIFYLLVFSMITMASMAKGPDFSGTWKLNKAKSTLNEQFSMAPSQVIVKQADNALDVEKKTSFQDQEFTTKEKFTLDGKECVNDGWQDSKKTSTAAWSADEKNLIISSKIPFQDNEMKIVENYSMDGANLKLVVTNTSSFGDMSETYLFDKQ